MAQNNWKEKIKRISSFPLNSNWEDQKLRGYYGTKQYRLVNECHSCVNHPRRTEAKKRKAQARLSQAQLIKNELTKSKWSKISGDGFPISDSGKYFYSFSMTNANPIKDSKLLQINPYKSKCNAKSSPFIMCLTNDQTMYRIEVEPRSCSKTVSFAEEKVSLSESKNENLILMNPHATTLMPNGSNTQLPDVSNEKVSCSVISNQDNSHYNEMSSLSEVSANQSKRKVKYRRKETHLVKALRTIGFMLGAFLVCWIPYHVVLLIESFCREFYDESCVHNFVYQIAYCLCYLNSAINPFCYGMTNLQIRKTLLRILKGNLRRK